MSRVAILLSTYNGQRFLPEQLDSLVLQTYSDWVLYWRDDGSTDETPSLLRNFMARLDPGRAVVLDDPGRVGATESFLRLLRAATIAGHELVSFADQDDVWLPEKLERGVKALQGAHEPALYFARQWLVDADLRPLALSPVRRPGFPAALTQNVATGCTMMLNGPAARLVARSKAPALGYHDWWCYQLIAGAAGRLIYDEVPIILYRQHATNLVGAPSSVLRRGWAALQRGPGPFMKVYRENVFALADQTYLLAPSAAEQIQTLAKALRGGLLDRLRVVFMPGLIRQTTLETITFRLWFVFGRAPLDAR
jgi:glycosyltransferase involved in cell wall biosynthesis